MSALTKDLFVTWCALTRTTERATRRRGARYFLPALFVDRFANMGGIDKDLFAGQLDACRTFEDDGWVSYWRGLAQTHLDAADAELASLGAPRVASILAADGEATAPDVGAALAPAVPVFADRTPENGPALFADFLAEHPEHRSAATAVDHLVKAMTYLFAASWPGWSPARLRAYDDSRRLLHVLLLGLAPAMNIHAERIELNIAGEKAIAYGVFPDVDRPLPTVLVTNGLEGTIQEVLVPAARLRDRGMAMIAMEMPGTFQYRRPLSTDTDGMYDAVIEQLAAHPRVDAERLGMLGLSFGALWSTRMAARNRRLKAVVANGGLYHRSFGPAALFGMPEIMVRTLKQTVGATWLPDMGHKLDKLSVKKLYPTIPIPVLAINGDHDTLASTRDTVDLAQGAPRGELLLYPDDDHCAMGHYTQWLDHATDWLQAHLA
ncbi:alpha/beta hydrolase family protein [Spongisporangium articulatum]|uniref:Alpha/beta hydrolase family protein n=1 Tax=Spongisporangium articulatum TaxID=3362603 RepID=A0ABW8AV45_9ACTN